MVTGAVSLLALGSVVAVAAGSLPGGEGEPLLEIGSRDPFDPSPALAWIILFLALVGAVIWAMSLVRPRSQRRAGKRGLLAVLIGLAIFLVLLRWARPAAEQLLAEPPSGVDPLDGVSRPVGEDGSWVWLFGLLLAGVMAAVLTRVGLSLLAAPADAVGPAEEQGVIESEFQARPAPTDRPLGDDPRSRVLQAYQRFESDLAAAGHPRGAAETTGHHARTAASRLALDQGIVNSLVDLHSAARYGAPDPNLADAGAAEHCESRLREQIRE
jgi:hypothetical protein